MYNADYFKALGRGIDWTLAKPVSAPLISSFTGVENYKGRADQIEALMVHVTAENYANMLERVSMSETRDTVVGNSNLGRFMELFGRSDAGWIDKINGSAAGTTARYSA